MPSNSRSVTSVKQILRRSRGSQVVNPEPEDSEDVTSQLPVSKTGPTIAQRTTTLPMSKRHLVNCAADVYMHASRGAEMTSDLTMIWLQLI